MLHPHIVADTDHLGAGSPRRGDVHPFYALHLDGGGLPALGLYAHPKVQRAELLERGLQLGRGRCEGGCRNQDRERSQKRDES